jgi:dTDP-4-amino-4,6-dideoxygalactose transaminase
VYDEGDVALFGLGISKTITSIFGGMLTMRDAAVAERIREWRDRAFTRAGWRKSLARRLYLIATLVAFQSSMYRLVTWLDERTPLLDRFTKAYHLDGTIELPPDYLDAMMPIEARVGLAQLAVYGEVLERRAAHAHYYDEALKDLPGLALPPIVDGATYSHYVVRVADREGMIGAAAKRGVQFGELIQYSVPHFPAYAQYAGADAFPHSLHCSHHLINLPVYAQLTDRDRQQVVTVLRSAAQAMAV